ncbi:hypothetical protein O9G_005418 [Rozella allomycis CSF55]|uniref:Uncharacterized protein n=1 Tax=Rozella allomycis (strain CSF55) TaxID=988480 RepID=A0A075AVS2_ROZAC|nr:hypothetical protein O9G_005418 [Rozella allomycis CSF55]|eukprot:EPZ32817.1 hypothetical protein O9G_005418 [Rozella allomycis CSF55]
MFSRLGILRVIDAGRCGIPLYPSKTASTIGRAVMLKSIKHTYIRKSSRQGHKFFLMCIDMLILNVDDKCDFCEIF